MSPKQTKDSLNWIGKHFYERGRQSIAGDGRRTVGELRKRIPIRHASLIGHPTPYAKEVPARRACGSGALSKSRDATEIDGERRARGRSDSSAPGACIKRGNSPAPGRNRDAQIKDNNEGKENGGPEKLGIIKLFRRKHGQMRIYKYARARSFLSKVEGEAARLSAGVRSSVFRAARLSFGTAMMRRTAYFFAGAPLRPEKEATQPPSLLLFAGVVSRPPVLSLHSTFLSPASRSSFGAQRRRTPPSIGPALGERSQSVTPARPSQSSADRLASLAVCACVRAVLAGSRPHGLRDE